MQRGHRRQALSIKAAHLHWYSNSSDVHLHACVCMCVTLQAKEIMYHKANLNRIIAEYTVRALTQHSSSVFRTCHIRTGHS